MQFNAKNAIMTSAASLMMLGASLPAQAQEASADVVVRAHGGHGWKLECAFERDNGRQSMPSARGRGSSSTGVVVGKDAVSGQCLAQAHRNGSLTLSVTSGLDVFGCPFGETGALDGEPVCETVLAAGGALEFSLGQ